MYPKVKCKSTIFIFSDLIDGENKDYKNEYRF